MSSFKFRMTLSALALATCGVAMAQNASREDQPSLPSRFEGAMADYDRQHYQAAYEAFVTLADAGHAEAARLALMMARYGRSLYGTDFKSSGAQQQAWARAAVALR